MPKGDHNKIKHLARTKQDSDETVWRNQSKDARKQHDTTIFGTVQFGISSSQQLSGVHKDWYLFKTCAKLSKFLTIYQRIVMDMPNFQSKRKARMVGAHWWRGFLAK